MSITLKSIESSRKIQPDRGLLHGLPGVGKSSWLAEIPGIIVIPAEDGLAELEVPVFPQPKSFTEIREMIEVLRSEDHQYKAVGIDTIDAMEAIIHREICEKKSWANIEAPGYGKGYSITADTMWRPLLDDLETLQRERGMEVWLVAHTTIKTFSNPQGEDWSRYIVELRPNYGNLVCGWVKTILFAQFDDHVDESDRGKNKGVGGQQRIVHTRRHAAYDAKNRYGLPQTLPLDYAAYAKARDAFQAATPDDLMKKCKGLLEELEPDEGMAKKIEKSLAAAKGNGLKLQKSVVRLQELIDNSVE